MPRGVRTTRAPTAAANCDTASVGVSLPKLPTTWVAASADERRLILLNLHIAVPMPAGRVGLSREMIVIQRLEAAALARNHDDFIAFLAQALRIPAGKPWSKRLTPSACSNSSALDASATDP